jgi:hypothetical protein
MVVLTHLSAKLFTCSLGCIGAASVASVTTSTSGVLFLVDAISCWVLASFVDYPAGLTCCGARAESGV